MNEAKRQRMREQVLLYLAGFRALRVHSLCAEPFQRDVSLPQLHLLATLQDRGAMTVSELAGMLGVSLPSASSIVDRLDDRGYVTRSRAETDRRVVTVQMTEKGRQIVEEFIGLKREQMLRLMAAMSDEELAHFVQGMAAFRSAVERSAAGLSLQPHPLPVNQA